VTGHPARIDRAVVAALSLALPAHFRARQRAEWTADLLILAGRGRLARWRYLFAAAWTLPALRAVARRRPADGPEDALAPVSRSVVLVARVLTIVLGWTVVSWAVMLPGRYLILDIPGRMAAGTLPDPKSVWPGGDQPAVMTPVAAVLEWGGWAAAADFPLPLAIALVTTVLLVRHRWEHRRRVAVVGVAAISLQALLLTPVDMVLTAFTTIRGGPVLPLAGATASWLAVAAPGLSGPRRAVLGVLGLAALAVAVVDSTIGTGMVSWYRD
jgi:hypothetical protein